MEEGRKLSQEEKMKAMGSMTGQPPPQPKEQPKEEPKDEQKEEPKEEIKEVEKKEPVEQQKDESKEEPKEEFDIASFNKRFEREFEKEEDIKSVFEKAGKTDELQKAQEELQQQLNEYKRIAEQADPLSNFLNEDEYIRQQFLIKKKDQFDSEALNTLSALTPSRIKELDGVDALRTDLMVNQGLNREEAEAYLSKKYDVDDFNSEDVDIATKASMKVDVKTAKERLSDLYKDIHIPEKTNWEEARTQLKDSWEKPLQETIKSLNTVKLEDGVDFAVTEDMKEGLYEETVSELLSQGIAPSEEALGDVVSRVNDKLVLRNMDKVIKSITSDIREKVKAEFREQVHNDKPLNTGTKDSQTVQDNDSKIRRMI